MFNVYLKLELDTYVLYTNRGNLINMDFVDFKENYFIQITSLKTSVRSIKEDFLTYLLCY